MADIRRYVKPCMTNPPPDLGRAIFKEILSTPNPDFEAMEIEVRKLEKENLKVREYEKSSKTFSRI